MAQLVFYISTILVAESRHSNSLWDGRFGDRIPSRPAVGTTQRHIQGVPRHSRGKDAGAWRWPPTPSIAEVKERVELYLYSPSGFRGLLYDELYLFTYGYHGRHLQCKFQY
jgi:hypothetical protein